MKDSKDLINKFVEEARALQKKYEELGTMVFAGDCEQEIAVVLSQGTREKVLDVMSATIRSSMPIADVSKCSYSGCIRCFGRYSLRKRV